MTTLPDINLLTGKQIEDVLKTCDSYLGKKLGLEGAVENTKFPIVVSSLNLSWPTADSFEKDINFWTKEVNIRSAYAKLYTVWEQKLAQEKSEKVEKTTLTPEEAKKLGAEARKREQQRVQSVAKSQKDVEEFVKQQKMVAEEARRTKETLKDKKIYVKVSQPEPVKLTADEQKAYKNLQSMAQETPHILVKNITKTIEEKLPEPFRGGATPEEIHYYAESVAVRAVDNLRAGPIPPDKDSVVLASLSNLPKFLDKIGVSEADKKFVVKASSDLATLKMLPYRANQEILATVFGKNVTELIVGPDPTNLSVTFTDQPQEATDTVSLDKLAENYQTAAESPFFSEVQSFGVDEIKGKLIDFGKEKVLERIGKLPADSFFGKIAASEKFSSIINLLKPSQTIEATNLFGKLVMNFSPEFAPVVSGIGQLIGVDFGLISVPAAVVPATTEIAVPAASLALESVATATGSVTTATTSVAAKAAVKTGLSTLVAKGLAALGLSIPIPIVNVIAAAIGAFLGWVAGKIIEPIANWIKRHQEDLKIVGLMMLGGGAVLQSIPMFIFGGLIFIPTALKTGFSLAGITARTTFLFGRIGASMAITIGTPIIVAIVVFPILVAIILFIINSGAYIVPPSNLVGLSENPYIGVDKTANPAGPFKNSDIPLTVEYTVTITAKKSSLTHIKIVYECKVIKESSSPPCPAISGEIPNFDDSFTISPTIPYSFSYSVSYDSSDYYDSLITDTITVTADASDGAGQTTSGSASIIIGKPPTKCFKPIGSNWPANYFANLQAAIVKITTDHPVYAAKVCAGGDIKIAYDPTPHTYWGFHDHALDKDITLYSGGLGSQLNAEYILTHESAHHFNHINAALYSEYTHFDGVPGERPICSYAATSLPSEAFAEAAALYGSEKPLGQFTGCAGTSGIFKENYPKHWEFENTKVFR